MFDLVTEVPPYPDPLGISTEIDLRVAQQLFASGMLSMYAPTFVHKYVCSLGVSAYVHFNVHLHEFIVFHVFKYNLGIL